MERGAAYGDSSDVNRFQHCRRGEGARPPHVYEDVHDLRGHLTGLELESEGPARTPGDRSQFCLEGQGVDFQNQPVDLKRELLSQFVHFPVEGQSLFDAGAHFSVRIDPQSPFFQAFQQLPLGGKSPVHDLTDPVAEDIQRPLRGDGRVQLAEGSCRSVPRVCEERLPRALPLEVEFPEGAEGQKHFSPHFQAGGKRPASGRAKGQRNGFYGFQVLSDVFPHETIPPGGPGDKSPFLVDQLDGNAVHLELGAVFDRCRRSQEPFHPGVEFANLFLVKGVGQAEHGEGVADSLEFFQGRGPDPLGGRGGGDEAGELEFQGFQFPQEPVVLRVGYGGVIENVIAVVMEVDLFPEFFDSLLGLCFVHTRIYRRERIGR